MRIIAGEARGMKLASPVGRDIRPTSDRVREAVFNVLMPYLAGARFLDLYAGTGANGLEALSRGAAEAVLVEGSPEGVQCIRNNLIHTKLNLRASLMKLRLPDELEKISGDFDLIFADPPYADTDYSALLEAIGACRLLKEDGLLLLEHRKKSTMPPTAGGLHLIRTRTYGDTAISQYEHPAEDNAPDLA